MKTSELLKNIFLVFIIIQFIPLVITTIKNTAESIFSPKTRIGVLPIKGVLTDSSYHTTYLNTFFKDKKIKAILIKMECPGGAAGTAKAIHDQIISLKKDFKKPVVCLVENICASGGYYIACTSDSIIAPATALVGSIGATFPYAFQLKDLMEQWHVGYIPLKAGAYKNAANPFVAMTPEEQGLLQGILDDSYRQFAEDVAASRHLNLTEKDSWANGKLFTAAQAYEFKLIDELGSAYNAEKIIREKAGIDGEIEWVKPPSLSPFARMFGAKNPEEEQGMASEDMLTTIGHACVSYVLTLFSLPG